jgi:alpha-L-fucosidase
VQSVLREIGGWLQVNGEAIYGTRAWSIFGEGPTGVVEGPFHDSDAKPFTAQDFRFTRKGNELYAIEMGWPDKGEVIIHTLNETLLGKQKISSLKLLGANSSLAYEVGADGLHIHLPIQAPGKYAYAFQIEFAGPIPVGLPSDQH